MEVAKKRTAIMRENSNRKHNNRDQNLTTLYFSASQIINKLKFKSAHLKNLVYGCQHAVDKRRLLALVIKTLENKLVIDEVIKKSILIQKPENADEYSLAQVAVCEILFGKGKLISNASKLNFIQKQRTNLIKIFNQLKKTTFFENLQPKNDVILPRYVHINTILSSTVECIQTLKLIPNLKLNQFMVDYHFPEILVFCAKQQLFKSQLLKNGSIFISDKASFFPPFLLSPPPGSAAIDACAAPGLKTIHIAAKMQNEGQLFAFDLNPDRFKLLQTHLKLGGVNCCKASCIDFLHVNTNLEQYENVEYVLVDPSCSGSGMVARMSHLLGEEQIDSERLKRISSFQISVLKRALHFPNVKRVVYSTCSVHVQENEEVVLECLNAFKGKFQVVEAFPDWPERGDLNYEFGSKCLRTNPAKHATNGFFVAVIELIGWSDLNDNVPVTTNNVLEELNRVENKVHKRNKKLLRVKKTFKLPKFHITEIQ